jgi:hypothetical protein
MKDFSHKYTGVGQFINIVDSHTRAFAYKITKGHVDIKYYAKDKSLAVYHIYRYGGEWNTIPVFFAGDVYSIEDKDNTLNIYAKGIVYRIYQDKNNVLENNIGC